MMADDLLTDGVVIEGLKRAWLESNPGIDGGHEEGGFIVLGAAGVLQVVSWAHGTQDRICVPSRRLICHVSPEGRISEAELTATILSLPD